MARSADAGLLLAGLLSLTACAGEDADRWRYEKILHEETPEVRSRDEARE